jgi:3-deoxy-manno-octulosonate cytidylyltransferase (CMP-KDO synthetase)
MTNICALIPARYESTRLPGKPLLKIGNKTIIQRTYEQTLKSKLIDKVYVVTDDDRIIEHIKSIGGEGIKIDSECLNGTERICKTFDILDDKYDIIDFAIKKYMENQEDTNMVCTTIHTKLTDENDINGRTIGKMVMDKYDNVMYCSRSVIPHSKNGKISKFTNYYGHIGIFIFRRSYLPSYLSDINTPAQLTEDIEWLKIIEHGYKIKSYLVDSFEIGINTMDDFNYLSKKYSHK